MNRRVFSALCASAVILAVLSGCGAASGPATSSAAPAAVAPETAPALPAEAPSAGEATYDVDAGYYDYGAVNAAAEEAGTAAGAGDSMAAARQSQKIIIEAYIDMLTDRFDEVSGQARDIAAEHGGYIQSSDQYASHDGSRNLSLVMRVPSENYEAAAERVKGLCTLRSASENQRNATAEYYDIQARLDTRLAEERRLLELIESTEDIEAILELEEILGRVRTDIEVYQSQMTNIDRLSSYSTISLSLQEVMDESSVIVPENLPERVYAGFVQSVNWTARFAQNVLIALARVSFPLIVAAVAAAVTWGLFKLRRAAAKARGEGK